MQKYIFTIHTLFLKEERHITVFVLLHRYCFAASYGFFFFFSFEAHCSSSVWLMGNVVIVYPVDAGGVVEIV